MQFLTEKQPTEAYYVSFDFTADLGVATISSAVVAAFDQAAPAVDLTATITTAAKQAIAGASVFTWVKAGTAGHVYTITCKATASDGSVYEIDSALPVAEAAGVIEPVTVEELKRHLRLDEASTVEDDDLAVFITAAREFVEAFTHRQLITATWDLFLDWWYAHDDPRYQSGYPYEGYGSGNWHSRIKLPFGELQSVTWVKWMDINGNSTTMTPSTDYLVDVGKEPGAVFLPFGKIWPVGPLYPSSPINIRFVCGYGAAGDTVPQSLRTAIKMIAADFHENREGQVLEQSRAIYQINATVERILWPYRTWTGEHGYVQKVVTP
jgi:hypothetical protein